jgi:hypothetical protein
MLDFLGDVVKGTALAATTIASLPVLGAVGTISAAGAVVAVAVGTTAAAIDHTNKDD